MLLIGEKINASEAKQKCCHLETLQWYNGSMKEKTSITLSKEVLAAIDRIAGSKQSRSAFIEAVLAQYLRNRTRAQIEARDFELINRAADELSREVEDVLQYQDLDV
jgi:metal-responsive CopG/Arc/MetJ family transcriptional regulator